MDGGFQPVLFTDEDGASKGGFVSSIQVRDIALNVGEIAAFGRPSSSGIPQEIPEIPSFVESWNPSSGFSASAAPIVIRINPGDTTVSEPTLTLNGVDAPLTTSSEGVVMVFTHQPTTPFPAPSFYAAVFSYTETGETGPQTKSLEFNFQSVFYFEDFESIELGPNLDEALAGDEVYSLEGPAGASEMVLTFGLSDAGNDWYWAIDNIEVAGESKIAEVDPINITEFQIAEGMLEMSWIGGANVEYIIQKSTSIGADADWQEVARTSEMSSSVSLDGMTGFIRVIQE
jgi:hypothetical protein